MLLGLTKATMLHLSLDQYDVLCIVDISAATAFVTNIVAVTADEDAITNNAETILRMLMRLLLS